MGEMRNGKGILVGKHERGGRRRRWKYNNNKNRNNIGNE
jgi:YD repeat-containing protein